MTYQENAKDSVLVLVLGLFTFTFLPSHWIADRFGLTVWTGAEIFIQFICVVVVWASAQYLAGRLNFGLAGAAMFGIILVLARLGKASFDARNCSEFQFLHPDCVQHFVFNPLVYGPVVTVGAGISLWFAWQEFTGRYAW